MFMTGVLCTFYGAKVYLLSKLVLSYSEELNLYEYTLPKFSSARDYVINIS